jgi:2-iminobutanoate/2-iminopropanoate deaminase
MTRDARFPAALPRPTPPYSPAVIAGDLVFTAGQVAFDREGAVVGDDVATQTRQVLANVAACLAEAGCAMDDVVKTTVFLADLADFAACNDEYRRHFTEPYPARSTVQAGLAPGLLVEIEVIARRSEGS